MKINGDVVRKIREAKSWSQEHLAAAAGLSTRTVQRVESDGIGSAETRLALAAALGVPVAQLMGADTPSAANPSSWDRIPLAAWVGLGLGAACSIGAVAYSYISGAASVEETARSAGILCGLLGLTVGAMGAVRGFIRSRTTAA
jgi:DNA-binding XRE family transcriptional regulator